MGGPALLFIEFNKPNKTKMSEKLDTLTDMANDFRTIITRSKVTPNGLQNFTHVQY